MTQTQSLKAMWVAIGLLLVALSVTVIWQGKAISRLQDAASQTSPVAPYFQQFQSSSDSRRIANLERQVEEDRWQADLQRKREEDRWQAEEWERALRQERWK